MIGTFASAYVNAGNLGLPIAAYVLGDASLVAPMLLTQLLVLQPLGLLVLDLTTARVGDSASRRRRVLDHPRPDRPAIRCTVGSLLGLLLSIFAADRCPRWSRSR